jgi:hypothetical protein
MMTLAFNDMPQLSIDNLALGGIGGLGGFGDGGGDEAAENNPAGSGDNQSGSIRIYS